ncbi:MAG: PAS domain S-box protein [Deltaproteobacteria bacterium]|nr:PAS domain S-box protein [Deltaproteobacteria bacterium]
MDLHYTHIALISFITSGISIAIAFISWKRRSTPSAFAVMLLMLAIAEWTFARTFEALAVEMSFKVMWAKFEYFGIMSLPIFWLLFTLQYTHSWNKIVTKRNISLLFIIPLITLILVFTNEWHGLIWQDIVPSPGRETDVLIYDHGIWFWAATAQNYFLVLVGTLILLRSSISHFSLYKMQSLAIFTATAIPWISNAIYLMGYSPVPGLDLTPIAFMMTGVIIGWSVFRYRFLDLAPVARNTLFEALSDGVVVLDTQDRIVDFNSRARQYFKSDNKPAIGEKAEKVIPALFRDLKFEHNKIELNTTIQINDDSQSTWIDMRVSPLTDQRDRLKGRLVVLRDITKSQRMMNALKESEERINAIFRTSPIGICLVIDQEIEWVNETMCKMVGYEEESLIGQSVNIICEDHDNYEWVVHQLDAEIFQFGIGQVETRLITKDGSSFDCIIRASNFSPPDPSKGQILVISDVSEINRLRLQLERARK